MKASSSHLQGRNPADDPNAPIEVDSEVIEATAYRLESTDVSGVIDVSPVTEIEVISDTSGEDMTGVPQDGEFLAEPGSPANSTALVRAKGSFSTFLAPLTQDSFRQVVTDVEEKLKVVNQTLSMLDMQGFDSILEEMLSSITFKTAELLNADRASIFLLDDEKDELYTIVAQGGGGGTLEIRIPADKGIAGEVATSKKGVNIPYDFFDDPRSAQAKIQYEKTGYRTYTMLAMPLLDEKGDLVAVVQMMNKMVPNPDPSHPLAAKVDPDGFKTSDEQLFEEFAPSIRLILESSRSFYVATQKQRAANALIKATQSLSQSSLDLDDTLKRVMDEAKELMNADRSTLWLIDPDTNEIWTKIENADGTLKELRIPVGIGFAGHVAATGKVLNIPFDLYSHPDSETSKALDQTNGYRTCSLLCMPVFADGELIGVTQLLNKKKQGEFPPYDPACWPEAPDCWRASFNRTDQEFMETFNIQAGVALKNAKLFATVKQQEQMQRDILRSLSNGVISTDKDGGIIAVNESAKEMLGVAADESLEGRSVCDLIRTEKGDFPRWFNSALKGLDSKSRQQYYPDQTLQSVYSSEQHSVNLSINTIADANDSKQVSGALVVMDDISDEKRLKSTMYRYMTQELAEQLLSSGEAKLGGDRKDVSVLFSDIRGYTSLTESMEAEEVVTMLNEYFEAMVEAVFTYKGTLDKYIGDAIMAVFGSPLPLDDHAWMAAQTAIEMRHRLAHFNASRPEAAKIRIGIGINSDSVISGNIGSSRRMEFTAIGDGVNLGSRLESASKQYGCDIVISDSTYEACKDRIWARELDRIRVKGKTKPVSVYGLVALRSEEISDDAKRIIELYNEGRKHYLARNFTKALLAFGTILEDFDSKDKASELHLKRINYWLSHPPSDEVWDEGVWTLTEK
ncbi:MAG TPA: adenylate/guanylate cyclase domain-containing protein [Chroococcidiopsis sp.]